MTHGSSILSNSVNFNNQVVRNFGVFVVEFFTLVVISSPSLYAILLACFVWIDYLGHRKLSLALLHVYFLTFFVEKPLISFPELRHQIAFADQKVLLTSTGVEIPVRFFIGLLMGLSVLQKKILGRYKKIKSYGVTYTALFFSLLLLMLLAINQALGENYYFRYQWFAIHLFEIFTMFLIIVLIVLNELDDKLSARRLVSLVVGFSLAILTVEGVLSTLQFMKRAQLGLMIEYPATRSSLFTVEQHWFRSVGTFSHPNYLGVNVSMLLIIPLEYYLSYFVTTRTRTGVSGWLERLLLSAFSLGLVALMLSLSRWAWVSFVIGLLLAVSLRPSSLTHLFARILHYVKQNRVCTAILLGIVCVILGLVFTRFINIGTWSGREIITVVALKKIGASPLLGRGPGSSGLDPLGFHNFETLSNSLGGVHNTILYIASENGLPVTLVFLGYVYWIFISFWRNKHLVVNDWFICSLFVVTTTFLINSLLYPLYLFDSSLELFVVMSGFYFTLLDWRTWGSWSTRKPLVQSLW